MGSGGKPEANKFIVTIKADCPPGIHEARVVSRLGVSSSRVFSVGDLSEGAGNESEHHGGDGDAA